MDLIRQLLAEDADNYMPSFLLLHGFSMQEVANVISAKRDEDAMNTLLTDDEHKKTKEKVIRFLMKNGKLETDTDEDLKKAIYDSPHI